MEPLKLKIANTIESLEATIVIKTPNDGRDLSLYDIRQILLSEGYKLEVALPHESSKDKLTLIFTEE